MITFENKIYEGIHYSRFVSSWINSNGGKCNNRFYKWLTTLVINGKHIPDDIAKEIWQYGANGKLELEENARRFLKNDNK